jgi:hypothetical protein
METRRDIVAVWREEVRKGFQAREDFWVGRLKIRGLDKVAVIFVCGADDVDTFKATPGANGIQACIHCRDWPKNESELIRENDRRAWRALAVAMAGVLIPRHRPSFAWRKRRWESATPGSASYARSWV